MLKKFQHRKVICINCAKFCLLSVGRFLFKLILSVINQSDSKDSDLSRVPAISTVPNKELYNVQD